MSMHGPQVCDHVCGAGTHTPSQPLAEIDAEIKALEAEIRDLFGEVGQ